MKQKFIEWFTNNNNGCSPAMEDDRSFVREKTQHMFEAYQAGVAEGEARCAALAAENAGLKAAIDATIGWQQSTDSENVESVRMLLDIKTPATDAFLAEVRAQARNDLCVAFVKHATVAGLDDGDTVTVKEVTDALLHCAEQLRKGVQS